MQYKYMPHYTFAILTSNKADQLYLAINNRLDKLELIH